MKRPSDMILVEGKDLAQALAQAERELGTSAVVLSRGWRGGRVVLAVAPRPTTAQASPMSADSGPAADAQSAPAGFSKNPATREVEHRLRKVGASLSFATRISRAVEARLNGHDHPLDLAGEELAQAFRVARAPHRPGTTTLIAFVGAPDSGKSTALHKLAWRLHDVGRSMARVEFGSHVPPQNSRVLGAPPMPCLGLCGPRGLLEYLSSGTAPEIVLLEGSTSRGQDIADLTALRAGLYGKPRLDTTRSHVPGRINLETFLVLSARATDVELEQQWHAIEELALSGSVITHLDHTEECARVLERVQGHGLPIAFLCSGTGLHSGLFRARGERLADLLLRGRLS